MDWVIQELSRAVEQLLGRAGGPLHFRLFVMPLVVTFLAIRAHLRDVKEGRSTALWAFIRDRAERRRLFRSGLKDFGKVFIVACVLDTTYQLLVLKTYFPVQMLIVAVACAIVPYFLIRGPVMRITYALYKYWTGRAADAGPSRSTHTEGAESPSHVGASGKEGGNSELR
jgi:hypothetical protein